MRTAWLGLCALLLAGCPGGGGDLPEPQTCSAPRVPEGPFTIDLGGRDRPWQDGEVVALETGGQGFKMLVVRTYLSGAAIPDCILQSLDLQVDGRPAGGAVHDLPFRAGSGGLYTAEPIYVVVFGAYAGAEIAVTASLGGQSFTRRIYAEQRPAAADAGPDAR